MALHDKQDREIAIERTTGAFTVAYPDARAGKTEFRDRGTERIFFHTEVDPDYQGRGLSSVLIAEAVRLTVEENQTIVAVCPTVRAHLKKHQDSFEGSWRSPNTDDLTWIKEQL